MSVLRHPETGNPKRTTHLPATSPQRTYFIGICKDMMSKMDPMRALGLQDEVVGTSFVTPSSLVESFAEKDYTNLRRARARTPNASHSFRILVLLAKDSLLPFIAARDCIGGQPVML